MQCYQPPTQLNAHTESSIVVSLFCQYVCILSITVNVKQLRFSYSEVIECLPVGISHLSFQSHGRSGDEPRGGPWEVSRRHVHPTESAGPTNVKENGIKCKYDAHIILKSSFVCEMFGSFTKKRNMYLITCFVTHHCIDLNCLRGKNTSVVTTEN